MPFVKMGVKVAAPSLQWSKPSFLHSPSSSQTLASAFTSPSSRRRSSISCDVALCCRFTEKSVLFGSHQSSRIHRSRSCDNLRSGVGTIRRAMSANLASFSDDEFSKKIQELALRFQVSDDSEDTRSESSDDGVSKGEFGFLENSRPFDAFEPPNFPERDEIIPANIERRANSFEIPLSLRMIKQKMKWQEGFLGAGELAYCSVKKAFASMVFIIQELHSYTLQMREVLFYEDLQGILASVQKEMHASFVWLFQKVFSQTPTLMVYVMILLANYSVYSISNNAAIATTPNVQAYEEVSTVEDQSQSRAEQKFDSSIIKTIKLSNLDGGNTTSIGGNNGGGGKYRLVSSGTEGDGRFDASGYHQAGDLMSSGEESVSTQEAREEEVSLWDSMVEEASRMQAASRDEALDQETMERLPSPLDAKSESEDQSEYFKTELLYQTGLAQEPDNPLLLANYAQFLYLVAQDYDRAEDYFKKAAKVEPKDAEALNKYANFLWVVRKDLWAAEETYLEAIEAEPGNSYYAANYAHFLWNTGGEDTCFPLSSPDSSTDL